MTTYAGQPRAGRSAIDAADLSAVSGILRHRAGLLLPSSRHFALEAAMLSVMRRSRVADSAGLLALLADDSSAFDDLVAEVTIGETYFFREPAQFELIRAEILPRLIAARPGRRVRTWSAACASGEEAYSLAITLFEQQVNGEVLGTDVSRPRLSAAQEGTYRQWSLRGVPEPAIERWFHRDGDQFTVAAPARQQVTFGYLNLAKDTYPALSSGVWGMDIILCRNVLIYFDPPTIERVSRALLSSLSEDGWLLLGAADPPLNALRGVEVIETPAGLAYRRAPVGHRPATLVVIDAPDAEPWTVGPPVLSAAPSADPTEPREPLESSAIGITPALPLAAVARDEDILAASMRRDFASVVALLEAGQEVAPLSTRHRVLLVRALANLGRLSEAGRACASALDAQHDVAELHYLHSVLLMESGRPADAAVAAKRALYLDRGMIVAQLAAATALSRSGERAAAERALNAAERLLAALPVLALVPASDGETAGRLLEMTRVQRRLLTAAR